MAELGSQRLCSIRPGEDLGEEDARNGSYAGEMRKEVREPGLFPVELQGIPFFSITKHNEG